MKNNRLLPALLLTLVLLQVAVILGSWLWTAAVPETSLHSLLGNGGIRWLFDTFVDNLSHPILVWMILADITLGCCCASGLWPALKAVATKTSPDPQQKSGLQAASGLIAVELAVILLLILPTRAILLNATGHLFPSSFSAAVVPIAAFMTITAAIAYGLFSGQLHNYRDVFQSVCQGTRLLRPALVVYVLGMELICSVAYVIG